MYSFIQKPTRRSIFIKSRGRFFLSFPELQFNLDYICETKDNETCYKLCHIDVRCVYDGRQHYIPFLPNFYESGVCLGKEIVDKSIDVMYKNAINAFWASRFNPNGNHHFDDLLCRRLREKLGYSSLSEYLNLWQQKTKEDLKWIPDKTFFGIT
jgi:hypothetical protein